MPSTSESTHPTVAVVVPTHDRPELLRETIASIIEQDYPGEVEIVIVFDRSTPDRSLERSTTTRTVRVVENTRTPGLPGARNTGIGVCGAAELIAFCDDDDTWLPGKLDAQVRHLQEHPFVVLCTTGIIIDYNGTLANRPSPRDELTVVSLLHDRTTEAHPSTFVFRSSALALVGDVDETIPGGYSEDYDLLLRTASQGKIACLQQPLVRVRWGRTSYFANRWRMIVDAQRYLIEKHPEFTEHPRAEARLRGQIAFALAALGDRRGTLREVRRILGLSPLEKRWPVALAVALRLVSAQRALEFAHRTGRGI
jgi:glycosyltransferase involved in cell wall biosynthesis